MIKRFALDGKGVLGTLYNGYTDNLLGNLSINENFIQPAKTGIQGVCTLLKLDNFNRENVLVALQLEDDLRVSLVLNMIKIPEAKTLLNVSELFFQSKVEVIDYYFPYEKEELSKSFYLNMSINQESMFTDEATHMITTIEKGIHFTIILKIPLTQDSHEIRQILTKLCNYVHQNNPPPLPVDEERKINDLKATVLSNNPQIQCIVHGERFYELWKILKDCVRTCKSYTTLLYEMKPINTIHYSWKYKQNIFIPLQIDIAIKIETKFIQLSRMIIYINSILQKKQFLKLPSNLEMEHLRIQTELSQTRQEYEMLRSSAAESLISFRKKMIDVKSLLVTFDEARFQSLEAKIVVLFTDLAKLQSKTELHIKTDPNIQMRSINNSHSSHPDILNQQKETKLSLGISSKQNSMESNRFLNSSISMLDDINVLLLGETGVGKSTFINAFANYLAFSTLEQASKNEPIVLMPVSFIITVGDQFEEKKIDFGEPDMNENHKNPGQSVTRQCRSYIFNIGNNQRLRLIDTPGFGDTRGLDTDNSNMEHIIRCITTLPHLNAICFLLKPNEPRLNISLRSCFTELFNLIGSKLVEKLIFCYTNTRTTFYAPGNTSSLLRTMLKQVFVNDQVPYSKNNIFCFDSESFRYLAMVRAIGTVLFDHEEKEEFKNSWITSMKESTRLMRYIREQSMNPIKNFFSIRYAQMMIQTLARPILLTIYNIERNLAIRSVNNRQEFIELHVEPLPKTAYLCLVCSFALVKLNNIFIFKNNVHQLYSNEKCETCAAICNKSLLAEYDVEYRFENMASQNFYPNIEHLKEQLFDTMIQFTEFLCNISQISENPFLPWLDLFVQQESQIYFEQRTNPVHLALHTYMLNFQKKYLEKLNTIAFDKNIKLERIEEIIKRVVSYEIIKKQITATYITRVNMFGEVNISEKYTHININQLLN